MTKQKSAARAAILPPLVRGPKLAGQRRRVLNDLRTSRQAFLKSLSSLGGPQIKVSNTVDQEPRPSINFEFVPHNVPSDELKARDLSKVLFNRDYIAGCECKQACGVSSRSRHSGCSCIRDKSWHFEDEEEPVVFAYTPDGLLIDHILEHTLPIYECSEKCACDINCANKVVTRGRQIELEVFKTVEKGWGARSPFVIPKGTFISCYRGELLDPEGSERRGKEYDALGQTYLFDLDEWHVDLEAQGIPMLTIDAYWKGDISRFYNHSCDPNLKCLPVTHGVPQEYEVAFFTTRLVKPLEELCFDYDPQWHQKQERSTQEGNAFQPFGECLCGSKSCRGWMFAR